MYNNGDLKRKDNTLQFTAYDGEKRDIPIIHCEPPLLLVLCDGIRHINNPSYLTGAALGTTGAAS